MCVNKFIEFFLCIADSFIQGSVQPFLLENFPVSPQNDSKIVNELII